MTDQSPLVFIIDDDQQVRSSLVNLCRSMDLHVESFASPQEFLARPHPTEPACIILDVRFPGHAASGLELQKRLNAQASSLPIIFITGHGDVPMSVEAMKAGAIDFLMKPVREQPLLDAIRKAIATDTARRDATMRAAGLQTRFDSLTARERQVMKLVSSGLPNKTIAFELGISEVTVKIHRGSVMQKMRATSLPDLVRMHDLLFGTEDKHLSS